MSRSRSSSPALLALASTVCALSLVLGGCTDPEAERDEPQADSSSPKVIQPGAPGEDASTVGADETVDQGGAAHDDVAFMQMMIPHHAQALAMSKLAPSRASSPEVKAMARRILAAQRPEIITMAAWLTDRGVAVPKATDDPADYDHGEHGHDTMHGMLTAAQMRELRAASGREFDRLFLTGMIQHHEGAIAMADAVATGGTDVQVTEIANDIVIGQGAEIGRMRELLRGL
ncbi:uncharacterized protein (DUF305 family) [Nocardioides thalensis]|uniref:Uncharacterized protein (DUF305 family) n=1 Tax=Nocardioides thalensis TaxID=1914755 RepID=A0A853BWA8_9ACTN|nr:uncharacterized protein (DUF305 family) [Nocardioides thalensis]